MWTTPELVAEAAGLPVFDPADQAYLARCAEAGEIWARKARAAAGYIDDPEPTTPAPNAAVELGTTLYALGLYRERGSYDGAAAGYDGMGGYEPPGPTLGRVRQLLGIPRPAAA